MKDSNCLEKMVTGSTLVLLILVGIAVLALASSVKAQQTGNGELTINPGGMADSCSGTASGFSDLDTPHWWDVLQHDTIHMHIAPVFMICTAGDPDAVNHTCDSAADCNTTNGNCQSHNVNCNQTGTCTGTCSAGQPNTTSCTDNGECDVDGACTSNRCANGAACTGGNPCSDGSSCSKRCTAPASKQYEICLNDASCDVAGTCDFGSATCDGGPLDGEGCATSDDCQTCASGPKADEQCGVNADCTYSQCTTGSPNNPNGACDPAHGDDDCNYVNGSCDSALECSGDTSVVIRGHTATACTINDDCTGTDETECDTGVGLCRFEKEVPTSGRSDHGPIDVCYTTRADICAEADMVYCRGTCETVDAGPPAVKRCSNNMNAACNNDGQCDFAPVNEHPPMSDNYVQTYLRTVALGDPCTTDDDCPAGAHCGEGMVGEGMVCEIELNTSEACTPLVPTTCQNVPGSLCCGLTQGAYGAPGGAANKGWDEDCPDPGEDVKLGYIPAAICGDYCDPFAGNTCPNATTIGDGGNTVTLKTEGDMITWLPTGGKAGTFGPGNSNRCYAPFSASDLTGGGSKGTRAGVLAGQTLAAQMNGELSDVCGVGPTGGADSFTAIGFGGFTLPELPEPLIICTERSAPDKVLGNDQDTCEAFIYPGCVAGKTVTEVIACANSMLAYGTPGDCTGCSAADLNKALSNINEQFDQCGFVIDCDGHTEAGQFDCPAL